MAEHGFRKAARQQRQNRALAGKPPGHKTHAIKKAGEIVRNLWRWSVVGLAAAAMGAGLTLTAMPTGAHASQATRVTSSQDHIVTAACTTKRNYKGGTVTFTYCNGTTFRRGCTTGATGSLSGPLYAANGCQTQLYLYLTHSTSGTPALCVNPGTSTNTLKQYYVEYKIGSHTGRCGT
jgi:hypothetical protein